MATGLCYMVLLIVYSFAKLRVSLEGSPENHPICSYRMFSYQEASDTSNSIASDSGVTSGGGVLPPDNDDSVTFGTGVLPQMMITVLLSSTGDFYPEMAIMV
ncbi:hypothetical protein Ancab_017032 [Ancistrocladus abbreviatus]